jgi:hypothetical protein
MILKGSQRGGAKSLGDQLLKTTENEHVEVHEVRGFMASDLLGALREAEATAKGTRCKQFMFSVSLNPPERESVRVEVFEKALADIEERNGLTGQPRVIVFHEKEGRRHCHAVWSRIDAETMTARPLPFFKNKLREVSKQLYLENGWQMPRGLMDSKARDPRNFTLDEWQQAKRAGRHAGDLKSLIQECWTVSDSRAAFAKALEERGLYLAKGDQRAHVALTFEGETISIPRALGKKSKEVAARLGAADDLPSVDQTRQRVAAEILPRLKGHMDEARARAAAELKPLNEQRLAMQAAHQAERATLDAGQKARQEQETRERAERLRKGVAGLWDKLRGVYQKTRQQNELEALWSLQRDREQRHALLQAQLRERQTLQAQIREARNNHAQRLRDLHRDAANFRGLSRGEPPKTATPQERLDSLRAKAAPQFSPETQQTQKSGAPLSAKDRLERLRQESKDKDRERSPEHDLDR